MNRQLFSRERFLPNGTDTASGAIVMGIGIFIFGSMDRIRFLIPLEKAASIGLLVIWSGIMLGFFYSVLNGAFVDRHLKNPLNRFAIGTWIAGTSVLGNVLVKHSPAWRVFLESLALFNIVLWLGYVVLCLVTFHHMFRAPYVNRVHGVLLLSTVSTQSIVLLVHNVFAVFSDTINALLVSLGVFFYMIGFALIIYRFRRLGRNELIHDWLPSNCILHGAMSITGLAAITTGVLPNLWIPIWLWVAFGFIVVETLECIRLKLRVRAFGAVKGFGEYHTTQWSRIFTFGMFFAFTRALPIAPGGFLYGIRTLLLEVLPWIVLLLLVNEILLVIKEYTYRLRREVRFREEEA
ncbi:MAG TPA: hypothetical protein VFK44_02215 [Bacillales bacterium]|nr:hypothetical protein [Bacillales bacterium]